MTDNQSIIRVELEHDFRVKVFVPWHRKDWIQQIRSLPNRAWNKEEKYWSVPKTEGSFLQLKKLFGENLQISDALQVTKTNISNRKLIYTKVLKQKRFPVDANLLKIPNDLSFKEIQQGKRVFHVFVGKKIIIRKVNEEWLQVWIPFDKKGWIAVVKEIRGKHWDVPSKSWVIPYVKDSLKRLWQQIGVKYIQYNFEINREIPDAFSVVKKENNRLSKFKLNDTQKRALTAFEEKLMLENKAWRTIKTYKGLFTHFLAYFPNTKPSSINKEQIEKYIIFKKQENVSDSQLNQLINCLNCFFIRILEQEEKVVKLERPRKKKQLPNVFSLEEIERLLKATFNLKHKCMLILIYSGGLRKSELLDLRIEDLNFDRKTIFIKDSKGGKDRYTFFADIARKYLKEYFEKYSPRYHVFEGQMGGRYGESSLHKIFDEARKISKVTPSVTLHGLRHSFATHMVEKGVPLHIVQDLLGHSSIKTTEIYLHISNKFRKELKSPLDDLTI